MGGRGDRPRFVVEGCSRKACHRQWARFIDHLRPTGLGRARVEVGPRNIAGQVVNAEHRRRTSGTSPSVKVDDLHCRCEMVDRCLEAQAVQPPEGCRPAVGEHVGGTCETTAWFMRCRKRERAEPGNGGKSGRRRRPT